MGATAFSVRPATADDLPEVRRLLAGAGLPADDFAAQFGERYAVAVDATGRIVGAEGIEIHGDAGLLRSAVVDAHWRGRGVGEALTRDRLRWARAQGLESLWLLTTTAAAWFPRFGFERADRASAPAALQRSSEFAGVCPSSATTMRLDLRAEATAPA